MRSAQGVTSEYFEFDLHHFVVYLIFHDIVFTKLCSSFLYVFFFFGFDVRSTQGVMSEYLKFDLLFHGC